MIKRIVRANIACATAKKNKKRSSNAKNKLKAADCKRNYSISYSHVISYRSTDDTGRSLTAEIRRDLVFSPSYGRNLRVLIVYTIQTQSISNCGTVAEK